jgi:hypothetical protein
MTHTQTLTLPLLGGQRRHDYLPRRKATTLWKASKVNMKTDRAIPLREYIDNDVALVPMRIDENGEYHIKLSNTNTVC